MRSALILSLATVSAHVPKVRRSPDAVSVVEQKIPPQCVDRCKDHLNFVRECFWTSSADQPASCLPICDDNVWTRYQDCMDCSTAAGLDKIVLDLGGVCADGAFQQSGLAWRYHPLPNTLPVPSASETIVPASPLGDVQPEPGVAPLVTAPATLGMDVAASNESETATPTPTETAPSEATTSASRRNAPPMAVLAAFVCAAVGMATFFA